MTTPSHSHASRSDAPTLIGESCPDGALEWCVDDAGKLTPMTELTLWAALTLGHVSSAARVWRLGMERWLPVAEVRDLRLALPARSPAVVGGSLELSEVTIPEARPSIVAPFDSIFSEAITPAPVTVVRPEPNSRPAGSPEHDRPGLGVRLLGAVRRALSPITVGTAATTMAIVLAASGGIAPPAHVAQARSLAPIVDSVLRVSDGWLVIESTFPGAQTEEPPAAEPRRTAKSPEPGQRRRRSSVR